MDHTVSLHFQELCFNHLLSLSSNQHCADCRLQNPDWISLSYGAIICQRCSGVHRSLGVQNTRVRSIKLDTWTLKNLYFMFFITNDKVNEYFEANLPDGFEKPDYETPAEELADFIHEKYINRTYVDETKESPIDKANEKVSHIEEPIENTDQEEFFKIKQEELEKLIKARLKRLRPAIMFAVSSPQKDTGRLISKSSRKAPEIRFSNFPKRSLQTPSPPSFHNFSPRENNFLNVSHNKSPVNAQTSFLSLFDGLTVKSGTKSNNNLNSSFLTDDRRNSRRLSNFSLNELNPGEPIELTEIKTPPKKKKSQFFKLTNPPSIDLEMEDWSSKDHPQQQPQRLNTIEGVDGIDFGGTLETLPTPKLMTMDSLEQDLIVPLTLPQMAQHKSITLTLREAEKSNTSTHLKRPSEAFDTPRMILNETKLGHPGLSEKWRKTFVIIGCLIIHLLMGYMFCWGAISPEISAYFEAGYGLEFTYESRIHIAGLSTLLFFGMALGYAFSEKSVNIFGMRAVSFVSFLALSAVLSLSGLKINILLDIFLMTLLPGFCIGVIYPIPFYCAVQYFPRNINIIRIFFFIANGLGACIIANLYPLILSGAAQEADNKQISTFFEILAAGILILSLLGNVLIYPKVNFVEKEWVRWSDKEKSLLSNLHLNNTPAMSRAPSEIINATETHLSIAQQFHRPIKTLLSVISCYFVLPGFLCFAYKVEAQKIDPNTTRLDGGVGMLLMAFGRALGTFLYHKMGFKQSMRLAIIVQGILGLAMFVWGQSINLFVPIFFGLAVIAGIGLSILAGEASLVIKGKQEMLLTGVVMLGFAMANIISLVIFGMIHVLESERFLYLGLAVPMLAAFWLVVRLPEGQEYEKKHTEVTRMSTFRM